MTDLWDRLREQGFPDDASDRVRQGLLFAVARLDGESIAELLRHIHPAALPGVEHEARQGTLGGWQGWRLKVAEVEEFRTPGALGALSWHRNGWIRQAALERLPDGLPFLLLRLNDWVEPIRRIALQRLEALLQPEHAADLAHWFPLVAWLETCGRADHTAVVRRVRSLLRRCPEALERALDLPWRRLLYPEALAAAAEPARILDRALDEPDPAIAAWAARKVRHQAPDPARSLRMRRSRMAAVRAEGVRQLAREDVPGAEDFLLDPHPAVRDAARRVLGARPYGDFYAGRLTSKAALAGLGETGRREHAPLLAPFLADPRPGWRRAALVAFALLAPDAADDLLLERVGDPSARVAREAASLLRRKGVPFPADRLFAALSDQEPAHAVPLRLELLRRGPKWMGLAFLLEASERWPALATSEIQRWLQDSNRRSVQPTQPELEHLRRLLEQRGRPLPASIQAELRHLLRARG